MALPVLEKTWQFSTNNLTSSAIYTAVAGPSAQSHVLWTIKDRLKNMPLSPWIVAGSSDASTGGMDGIDRWTDFTKVLDGGNHSWIVLEQPGWNGGAQILIDVTNVYPYYQQEAIRRISYGGLFTGGSASTAPTATDSHQLGSAKWMPEVTANYWTHIWQTTDGSSTRIAVCANGQVQTWVMLETMADVEATTTVPILGWWADSNWNVDTWNANYARLVQAAWGKINPDNVHPANAYFAIHGYSNQGMPIFTEFKQRNEFTNEWHMWPLHVVCEVTGCRGWFGRIRDCYHTPGLTLEPGLPMPEDGSYQWVSVGDLWLPWDSVNKPVMNTR